MGWRRSPLSLLALAVCLLPLGIGVGTSEHSHAVAALHGALDNKAAEEAQVLDDYFSRARSTSLLTAHNPAFQRFYALPGDHHARLRAGGAVLAEVNRALGYLEKLFPTSIGEACFIDRTGPGDARVVRGTVATRKDLSPDESGNPFFAPTFKLRHGEVYQARPYVSPDTHEWVISNSTLMPTRDGSKQAIVHFEITVDSFRRTAAQLAGPFDILIVDGSTGAVIVDSQAPQRVGAPLGRPSDRRFRSIASGPATAAGGLLLGSRPAAYQRLTPTAHNANDWDAVAVSRTPVGLLYGVGAWPMATVAIALGLLVVALASFRATHRGLDDQFQGVGALTAAYDPGCEG